MSEWKKTRLGDLYALPSRNGLTRPSAVRGSGYKMAAMGEIFADDFIGASDMERVQLNERELNTMLLEEDDLLFARQSLILSGAGKCAIVRGLTEPTTFESHLIRVRLNKALANSLFYMYYFHSSCSPIKSIVQQGVQAGIRGSDLEGLLVDYPPLPIQDRIAGILSDYDSAIANCRKQIALLEEAAIRLYREWFKDGKGEQVSAFDACEIMSGGTPSTKRPEYYEGSIPFFTPADSHGYSCIIDTEKHLSEDGVKHCNSQMFPRNTVMVTARGTVGRVVITCEPMAMNQSCYAVCFKDSNLSLTLLHFLLRNEIRQIQKAGSSGVFDAIKVETFKLLKLMIPKGEEALKMENRVEPIYTTEEKLIRQIRTLTEARDRLLPKLMKGEVAV